MSAKKEKIQSYLAEGETLLWCGAPTNSSLKQCPDRTTMYLKFALLAVAVLATVLYLALAGSAFMAWNVMLTVFICVTMIPFCLAYHPISDQRALENSAVFAVTDRRVLSLVNENLMSLPRDNTLKHSVDLWNGQYGNLSFNEAVNKSRTQSRTNSVTGIRDQDRNTTGIVFYHIEDPGHVAELFA